MYFGRLPGNRGIGEQASEDKAQMDMGRDISGMFSGRVSYGRLYDKGCSFHDVCPA